MCEEGKTYITYAYHIKKKKKTISYIGHSSKCTNDAINTFWKVIKEKKKHQLFSPLWITDAWREPNINTQILKSI